MFKLLLPSVGFALLLLIAQSNGSTNLLQVDAKAQTLEILKSSSRLDKDKSFLKFLQHVKISADFNALDSSPDPRIEHYFVAADDQALASFFHSGSKLTILYQDGPLVRAWVETKNRDATARSEWFLSGIATVNLDTKRLESLVIPSSQIELEFDDGKYVIKKFGLEKRIEVK